MVTQVDSSGQPIVRVRDIRFNQPGQTQYVLLLRCNIGHRAEALFRGLVELAASLRKRVEFDAALPGPALNLSACTRMAAVMQRDFGVTAWMVPKGAGQ
jgi:hypothetical protein